MLNVGLTGGIGSGKSTVTRLFKKKGAYIIDSDVIAHAVEEPGHIAWKKIVDHFGENILNKDKTINREKLGTVVFSNKEFLKTLNNIVHPAVYEETKRQLNEITNQDEHAIVITDIPLLIEIGRYHDFDVTILVYISPEEQIKRIMKRNNFTRKEALDRLRSQMLIDEKIPYVDFVINNGGSLHETQKMVDTIWEKLIEKEYKKTVIIKER